MRFAISIPQHVSDGAFDPAALRGYLARAEALGFESAWTQEQILGSSPRLGPIEVMSYAAACTERLRLGCAVFVTPLYGPVHLAKSISTLDQLSRGRLEVGVGTGGRGRMFSGFGVDPDTLVARFNEGLLDAAQDHLRRALLAARRRDHGAQAVPEAVPADLVRRQPPERSTARGPARRRLFRRRVDHHRAVRRAGAGRAGRARGGGAGCRCLPDRQTRLHRRGR